MDMPKDKKKEFLKNVDLDQTDFQVKLADFGLSKRVSWRESQMV